MKVTIVDCKRHEHSAGETLVFKLNEVDNSFANGLRRVLLAEVPVLGVESVTIIQNTSVLPDEMIAHRIGLVPLYSKRAKQMQFFHDCLCGGTGCIECQITGELKVRCPSNQHSLQVFADSLKIDDEGVYPVSSEERGVWLLTLGRSQEINLRVLIRKSIAKTHAKFMPVSTVSMHYEPEVILNKDVISSLDPEQLRQWMRSCVHRPHSIAESNGEGHAGHIDVNKLCEECLLKEPSVVSFTEPLVFARPKKDARGHYNFTFTVETTGVLPVLQLIRDAVDVLRRKLQRVHECLAERVVPGDLVETRPIGDAPTAPVVVNEDIMDTKGAEDDLKFVMN
ncbi:RNA polymerase subunit, putative [Trypanosoma equiperdum]|uniref:Plastid-encoded RNA polymerase subunit alpha n=1 Tax=Trypanosoma equiperdum TaxID=5694 RepID=A0A1G4I4T2_TRYEQ|nr:RNA polymerase subunit, putative [Trypanosoma equiperdum]